MNRPDLSKVAPEVLAYIEALERQLAAQSTTRRASEESEQEPSEAPTTVNMVTISRRGMAKRTPRHLYSRQRRGGMGVFDLQLADDDAPQFLVQADEATTLTLLTNQGRAFRLAMSDIAQTSVSGRGRSLLDQFPIRADEQLSVVFAEPLPGERDTYLIVVTARGQVRRIGHQYVGQNLQQGTVLTNVSEGGAPVATCWSAGTDELFIVSRRGVGIRFSERLVPVRGCLGMRVEPDDKIIGVAATDTGGGVFLATSEGKGTIRLLSGFSANKSPGGAGKIAIRAEQVIGAAAVSSADDLFLLSRLGKIIRFTAQDIPAKEGVVQGVNCMNLRADECVTLAVGSPPAT